MSDINSNISANNEDLNWQAFLYVSGEMPGSEVAAFEDQLDSNSDNWNPTACEAVANAVRLGDAVVQAFDEAPAATTSVPEPVSQSDAPVSRDRFARWASLLAPAIAVVGVGWMLASLHSEPAVKEVVSQPVEPTVVDTADDTAFAGEMVRLWVESESSLGLTADEPQLLTAADVPDTLVADVPDWLVAAVQSQGQPADELSEPEVLEN